MKKFKRMGYIILIVIVVVLSLTIYTDASKDNSEDKKDKVLAEMNFIETKLINLFNNMNNIKIDNYNIVTTEISKDESKSTNTTSEGGQSQGQSQGQSSGGGESMGGEQGESQGGSSDSSGQSGSESSKEETKKTFDLQQDEILTKTGNEVNWDNIKSEVENLYSDLPSITMDLYQLDNANQEEILNFNSEYDRLIVNVKDEKKKETLEQLAKIYEFLPKFLKNIGKDELYTTIVETKSNIFKAYSKLDEENWEEISNDIKNGIDVYSKLLTNTNIDQTKQSNISKGYIIINELQNAVNIKDKSVFLIKYKNLLEEMNGI